jgi:hypothetical protein
MGLLLAKISRGRVGRLWAALWAVAGGGKTLVRHQNNADRERHRKKNTAISRAEAEPQGVLELFPSIRTILPQLTRIIDFHHPHHR